MKMHTEERMKGELGMYGGALYWSSIGAGLTICSQLIVGWNQTIGESKWWDIVTAVGTLGAVVVALSIASADRRRMKKAAFARAQLVALGLTPKLAMIKVRIDDLTRALNANSNLLADLPSRQRELEIFTACNAMLSISDGVALAEAPGKCAHQVGMLISTLGYFEQILQFRYDAEMDVSDEIKLLETASKNAKKLIAVCSDAIDWKP